MREGNELGPLMEQSTSWPFVLSNVITHYSMATSTISGAKILLNCLVREGVDCLFGYPGGVTLPLYDALYDHQIRHVLVRHEQNAAFAAQGYARATGKVGVCCATSGPGATNLVTGLVDALMDSIPIVAITGQVSNKLMGSDAFQEADTFGITRSATKHNFLVKNVADLPQIVHEAFYIAASGRPGPVLVDITKDVFQGQAQYEPVTEIHLPGYRIYSEGHGGQIRRAAQMMYEAERPFIYAGRRNRCGQRQRGASGTGRDLECSDCLYLDGLGDFTLRPSKLYQHARDAWQLCGQHGHDAHGPDCGAGRSL